jgi:hypothetical protein
LSNIQDGEDKRRRSSSELLHELHRKFSTNFTAGIAHSILVADVEARAKKLCDARVRLREISIGEHQRQLTLYLDEIFGDSICACYLSFCGMQIPARALLRRCLELGAAIAAYWDSPVQFWGWKEHDEDIRFSALFAHLQSAGFRTFCEKENPGTTDELVALSKVTELTYRELSDVIHPKPQKFATQFTDAYTFRVDDLRETLKLGESVQKIICGLLAARFSELDFDVASFQGDE